jgi:hypothetical protein
MKRSGLRALIGALAMILTLFAAPGVGLASAGTAHAATKLTHSQAAARFRAAGITWSSSGNCSDRYNSTCTSFDGIRLTTVEGAETLKSYTGCALNITGGTETGHASGTYSHWNGYKLDYSLYNCVSNYITSAFTYIGPRAGDGAAMYKSGSGNIYAHEGNHWDVVYYNCGGC